MMPPAQEIPPSLIGEGKGVSGEIKDCWVRHKHGFHTIRGFHFGRPLRGSGDGVCPADKKSHPGSRRRFAGLVPGHGLSEDGRGLLCRDGRQGGSHRDSGQEKIAVLHASFTNASCAHALDMDDGHRFAASHPGAVVIPASIAAGGASIMGLTREETIAALGMAGLQSAGLIRVNHEVEGSMVKPVNPGRAAMSGLLSCILAGKGARGPDDPEPGKHSGVGFQGEMGSSLPSEERGDGDHHE